MASRVFASRLASQMATKAARPAMRAPLAAAKRTITTGESRENFFSLNNGPRVGAIRSSRESRSIIQLTESIADINSV